MQDRPLSAVPHAKMALENFPDDVKRFILSSIPSVPYLEAMLLLRKESIQPWDGARLAKRLYISDKVSAELLSQLHASGILSVVQGTNDAYRYQPRSPELSQMIDRTAAVYGRHLVEVTNLIHSNTSKNAQHFADAFIWRKE